MTIDRITIDADKAVSASEQMIMAAMVGLSPTLISCSIIVLLQDSSALIIEQTYWVALEKEQTLKSFEKPHLHADVMTANTLNHKTLQLTKTITQTFTDFSSQTTIQIPIAVH